MAFASLFLSCGTTLAQQPTELRGGLEREPFRPAWLAAGELKAAESGEGIRSPGYSPYSSGADVPEEAEEDEGAAPAKAEDIFSDQPSRTLATARERRNADRANQTPAPAEPRGQAQAIDASLMTGTAGIDPDELAEPGRNRRVRTINPRAEAIENIEREPGEEDPYAPLGLRLGTFRLFPSLEQGMTWTSNADYSSTGREAILSETTLRLDGESDWSRHSASFQAYARLRKTVSGQEVSEPSGGFTGTLRLDLADGFTATGDLRYELSRESAASAVVIPGIASRPLLHDFGGGIGLKRETGKLRLGVRGEIDRLVYEDAGLSGGGTLSQSDRNSTTGTLTLRTGYEVSSAFIPFVEGEIGRRLHDETLDSAGYARSADRYGLRAGVAFDLGEKLKGEVAGGWIREKPDDARLEAIEGASVAAAMSWSPMRGTTVTFDADTTIETTTDPGLSGSILYSASLGIEREIRANLTTTASAGISYRDYYGSSGTDVIFDIEAGATWWLNRYVGLSGRAAYEAVTSNLPDRDTGTVNLFLGLRLRR